MPIGRAMLIRMTMQNETTDQRRAPRRLLGARRRTPPGAAPGTMIAGPAALPPRIRVIAYGADKIEELSLDSPEPIAEILGRHAVTWIDVCGLGDIETINRIGAFFDLHNLALEDVVNTHQRPKAEEYDDFLFVVLSLVSMQERLETEQISMFVGENFVITFQERHGDCFEPVRDRLRRQRGRVRSSGADYLAYALIDSAIDSCFPVLEDFGERVEVMEDRVVARADPDLMTEIHDLKRDLLFLRRAIWPLRELINALIRDANKFVDDQTQVYLRDCYDHAVQLIDMVETYREIASGLIDIYLSSISTKLNEVMKVLTIIATIFIPLSFIASVYGMNFDRQISPWNMPELGWVYGYPFALALMALTAAGLLGYCLRQGWIDFGKPKRRRNRRKKRPQ